MSVQPTMSQIIDAVAIGLGVTVTEVKYGRRGALLSEPGRITVYLANTLTCLSEEDIGTALGGCSPAAVATAYGQVAGQWRGDPAFRELMLGLSIAALAAAKSFDLLRIRAPRDLDAVALAQEVASGRLPVTNLSIVEIKTIACGLAALAGAGAQQLQEATHG